MVAIWYTRIDVDGNVVHQYGSQGVRSVFEVTNNFAVKGEDKAGQRSNVCDRVGDDAIDVDGLSNECHCNGGSMKIGVVSGVMPASVHQETLPTQYGTMGAILQPLCHCDSPITEFPIAQPHHSIVQYSAILMAYFSYSCPAITPIVYYKLAGAVV